MLWQKSLVHISKFGQSNQVVLFSDFFVVVVVAIIHPKGGDAWLRSFFLAKQKLYQDSGAHIQCWGKLLLKVMHYNIALLPKKVTNYIT